MRVYLKAGIFALALLTAGVLVSPSAQYSIQRGWSYASSILLGDGTVTAPSLAPASDPDTGIYFTPTAVRVAVDGATRLQVGDGSAKISADMLLGWSSTSGDATASLDTALARPTAKVAALGPISGAALDWATADTLKCKNFALSAGCAFEANTLALTSDALLANRGTASFTSGGATTTTVTLPVVQSDTSYYVSLGPNKPVAAYVNSKSTVNFTLTIPSTTTMLVDWIIVR